MPTDPDPDPTDPDPTPNRTEAAASDTAAASPTAKDSLPPGAARRRELRLQRRAERWRNAWRLLVFSALSAGLGAVLLRHGWSLRDASQVEVSGSRLVNRDQVILAGKLQFPLPLLLHSPQKLERTLSQALPVEQVRVSRVMLPPRLRIELVDRQAVARAQRHTARGPEQGYVDRLGHWIDERQSAGILMRPGSDLVVIGWTPRHQAALKTVLDQRQALGSGLREVRFNPDGSLWLTTAALGSLRLGPEDAQLARRLEVAAHLNRTLPDQMRGRRPQLIDLSDPEQPEVSLSSPIRRDEGGPATARRPPGGQ